MASSRSTKQRKFNFRARTIVSSTSFRNSELWIEERDCLWNANIESQMRRHRANKRAFPNDLRGKRALRRLRFAISEGSYGTETSRRGASDCLPLRSKRVIEDVGASGDKRRNRATRSPTETLRLAAIRANAEQNGEEWSRRQWGDSGAASVSKCISVTFERFLPFMPTRNNFTLLHGRMKERKRRVDYVHNALHAFGTGLPSVPRFCESVIPDNFPREFYVSILEHDFFLLFLLHTKRGKLTRVLSQSSGGCPWSTRSSSMRSKSEAGVRD